jgi:hypothetical protein
MTTAAQNAKEIRTELKSRYGWTRNDVSVRANSYSMGSSIRIEIKSAAVRASKVKEIAEKFQRIDRCSYSGEILNGGNRFVFVEYDRDLVESKADEIEPLIGDEPGRPVEIEGLEVWPCTSHNSEYCYTIPGNDDARDVRCYNKRSAAESMARAIFDGGFDSFGSWTPIA